MKQLTSYNRAAGYLNKLFDLLNPFSWFRSYTGYSLPERLAGGKAPQSRQCPPHGYPIGWGPVGCSQLLHEWPICSECLVYLF